MPIHLRAAHAGDLRDARLLADLDDQLFPENSFGSDTWRQELHHDLVVLAYRDDPLDPVGVSVVRPDARYNDIIRFGVLVDHRGTGTADRLMDLTRSLLRGPVGLYVRRDNARALRFYRRHGFAIHGLVHSDLGTHWAMIRR